MSVYWHCAVCGAAQTTKSRICIFCGMYMPSARALYPEPTRRITRIDYGTLDSILAMMSPLQPAHAPLLARLCSVAVLPNGETPDDLVTLESEVRFCLDGGNPATRLLTARDATARPGLLSVLTPLGNTLLGCTAGARASYQDRVGRSHTVTVEAVLSQPTNELTSPRNVVALHRLCPVEAAAPAHMAERPWPDDAA